MPEPSGNSYEELQAPGEAFASSTRPTTEGHPLRAIGTSAWLVEHPRTTSEQSDSYGQPYRVYRRRFFGLAQLILLNIVISWDWLTFAAVSSTSAEFYQVNETAINWLSIGFLFAFVVASPAALWVLNRSGPKASILVASGLTLTGNWIRYGGSLCSPPSFGVTVFGQIVIGLAQPFVLAAPTRYSSLWFSDSGRVSATAVASLASPLGGALGQVVGPLWAIHASDIPNAVLYTAIVSSVAALPAVFIPSAPPTHPSAMAAAKKLDLRQALYEVSRNRSFWLVAITFSVLVGFFNAVSSLLNQIFEPFGFSETDAGIAGGVLILAGLISSAIISPLIDHKKSYLLSAKILVPLIALSYIILIFMPATRSIAGIYVACALIGGTSFSLLPCALELLSLATHPVPPEVSSTTAWAGGQLLGASFIIIMSALQSPLDWDDEPAGTMTRALIFQAIVATAVVPLPLFLRKSGSRQIGELAD